MMAASLMPRIAIFSLAYTPNSAARTGQNFGFRASKSNVNAQFATARDLGVHLFVVKFDLSDQSNSDVITAWQDPVIDGTGDPAGGVIISGVDIIFDRITLADHSNTANGLNWDEIRLGDTFADVAGVPEPSSLILASFGLFGLVLRRQRRRRA